MADDAIVAKIRFGKMKGEVAIGAPLFIQPAEAAGVNAAKLALQLV